MAHVTDDRQSGYLVDSWQVGPLANRRRSILGRTALIAIRDVGRVGPWTRVLINGASGGVGTVAVQIAKALGAEVSGMCSTRNQRMLRFLSFSAAEGPGFSRALRL